MIVNSSETLRELNAEQKAQQESFKLLFEVYKHITTLSSGTIIILTTFLEKLFRTPKAVHLVPISMSCFLLSIIFSLSTMAQLAIAQQIFRPPSKFDKLARLILYWLSPLTFILGIVFLAILTILNLRGQGNQ